MDSLLFQLGYNQCDTLQYYELVSQDFEFYHDQAGVTGSREAFLSGVGSLCRLPYKPRRALRLSSLQVYPLYENGVLYGAVQEGVHDFYAKEAGKPEYLTSTARFVHLWLREEGAWKLARVLSYDHQVPKDD